MNQEYQNGKVYKITDTNNTKCYYGSTKKPLIVRYALHLSSYKQFKKGATNKVCSFEIFDEFGIENCDIHLVEEFPCKTKLELKQREGFHQKNNTCVNKNIAGRTKEMYYVDNIDKYREHNKKYRADNYVQFKVYGKQYYTDNKEMFKDYNREYYNANKDKFKAYGKAYYEKNKEKIRRQQKLDYNKKILWAKLADEIDDSIQDLFCETIV
jgi:hypothetical protein